MPSTADLCDAHAADVRIAQPIFRSYGGLRECRGRIETVKTFEDNSMVRAALEENGAGKVLVVDGGGSLDCALLGDRLAALAVTNRWCGVVVNGCIRDARAIGETHLTVFALHTHPMKSHKRGLGDRNVPVQFAGIEFAPGHYVYADEDGIIVSAASFDEE
ncbi:MAG: RraA family protein [Candidatus Hydrogenedentes bacterium]|nr:RraA family protein [Candidatus Hydrogenedentota bacterium]